MNDAIGIEPATLVAPARPVVPPRRRRLGPAALLSLGLHGAVIALAVFLVRQVVPVAIVPPDNPATVQLVMSPPGGETPATAAQEPQTAPAPPTPDATTPEPQPTPATTATAEAAPPPTVAPPPPAPPAQQPSASKLSFDFASIESDTNALVTGDSVVPASPDIKYRNRKPSYPDQAVFQGQQGAVILLAHVSEFGLVRGVDVVRSSGFAALDQAAREAVLTWHFLPSVKDGQPVPADVPLRFIFALD